MSDIKLKVGDRVRNIRANSSRKGWRGVIVQHRQSGLYDYGEEYYHVRYDNGYVESYQRKRSSDSLERVDNIACDHIKLGEWNITKQAYNGVLVDMAYGASMTQALDANGCLYNDQMLRELRAYMIAQGDLYEAKLYHDEVQIEAPRIYGTPCGQLEMIMLSSSPKAPEQNRRTLSKVRRNVITGKTQDDMVKELGHSRGVEQFNTRTLGKSTAQVLGAISRAMLNPGKPINLRGVDHAQQGKYSHRLDDWFIDNTKGLINQLGYKGFTFSKGLGTLIYNPIVTEETYVEIK